MDEWLHAAIVDVCNYLSMPQSQLVKETPEGKFVKSFSLARNPSIPQIA